jgi:hypothetical protein
MTTLYKFKAYYTDSGVGAVQDPAPTCTVINMADDTKLADAQATTASTNMPGLYSYEYSGNDGLDCVAWFKTTDTGCDVKELASYVSEKITTNLNTDVAGVETKLDTVDTNVDTLITGVTLADDAITAAKFDESTAYPLKSADTGVTQVARVGADSDTLETLSDEIAAVKAETAAILVDTGTTLDTKINTIDGIVDDILVDTSTTLDGKLNTIDTNVDSILADTGTDGVVVASGQTVATVTNLTNLPAITTNWLTAAGIAADAVTELQSGLALAADLQDVEDKIDVIAIDTTTEIPATLATLATSAALATVDANVDSVLADTNEIQAELADGGRTDLLIDSIVGATTATGVLLKDTAIEAIFNDVVVTGTYTFAQLMKIMASALAGKLSGGGSTTLTFKSVDGASDVIVATVDANGNRSAVTLTV